MATKTVVELDLVGYSDVCRALEENVGVAIVAQFNDQIQGFVDAGLAAVNVNRGQAVFATTGDGAIIGFDQPAEAHYFAAAVHAATRAHNADRQVASALRWFRIGAATGDLYQRARPNGGQEIAGTVIANAVRLEAAAHPGQLVADSSTFAGLPADVQSLYGPEETVLGKRDERFAARRCAFLPYAVAPDSPPTVKSILDLFDRLNPRDQLDRLMLVLNMPQQHRPPNTLTLFRRQDVILDWVSGNAEALLPKLDAALKDLIRRQPPLR